LLNNLQEARILGISGIAELKNIPFVPNDGIYHVELVKLIDETEIVLYGYDNSQKIEISSCPQNYGVQIMYGNELMQLRETHHVPVAAFNDDQLLELLSANDGRVVDIIPPTQDINNTE